MQYVQLNADDSVAEQFSDHVNIAWDADHFCRPSALSPEEATLFRVVPIIETPEPEYDKWTQRCSYDGIKCVDGQWCTQWRVDDLSDEEKTAIVTHEISLLCGSIDADADSIYVAALGNRATEYAEAETEAQAFKAVNYEGAVPPYVQAWATATGNSAQWAADNIIATADAWRTAQIAIRAHRLDCKEQARKATTQDELDTVSATWAAFVTSIKAQLGIA